MPSLSELLRAEVRAPVARELDGMDDRDARLDAILRRGREAWPDVPVAAQAWARFFARHLEEGDVQRQLADLQAADVHLALGCLEGVSAAHRHLDEQLRRVSRQALAGIRLGSIPADEVLQAVRVKLLAGDGHEAKLASYAGRGPLEGWLRVMLTRTALSMLRVRQPGDAGAREQDSLAELVDHDEDPALAAIRARCAPALRAAVEQAARELSPGDRLLLRMHLVDGLTIDDLAAVYGTHRATAARRLARARNALLEKARTRAIADLGLRDEEELASLSGLLVSQIDVTMRRILGTGEAPA